MRRIQDICNAFDQASNHDEQAAVIPREIGERLFERLAYIKMKPNYILDVGCGSGEWTRRLKKHYPDAVVVGFDLAEGMLSLSKGAQRWRKRFPLVRGDMHQLPFAKGTFDLVFANQALQWSTELKQVVRELNRVMQRDGCLMFSMLGLDTYQELFSSSTLNDLSMMPALMDMHDVGDCLLAEHFLDPVVDMEQLVVHYHRWPSLVQALLVEGIQTMDSASSEYAVRDGKYPLTYEVIYGHAWKGEQSRGSDGVTETFIPVSVLRRGV